MLDTVPQAQAAEPALPTIGRVVSVTGAKCVVALDGGPAVVRAEHRPQMGALFAIEAQSGTVLATVVGMSVPSPAQREGERELWIIELGLVGEISGGAGSGARFTRGVIGYPGLGDRVRAAAPGELALAFSGDPRGSVRIGSLVQDPSVAALVGVDDLLGKHFAVLGTTGTGKSCSTALVLRAILQQNPAAHIVLLDPHNEYATAFKDWGEVVNQRNMQLPYWLLTFEELVEVVLGDRPDRRQEAEILQDLIPIAKIRYGRGASQHALRRSTDLKFSVDTPVPYRMSELIAMIDERMGRLDNKRDLSPYRNLRTRLESISHDPRYAFMFGSLTVYDGMAQILGRLFRVPTNGRPLTIVELTGLPAEVTTVVVSVICRLTFDFALWSEGKVPVTLVCEEAHRYVPAATDSAFEPCRRAIAKIAKEGRKYGASLCVVTQRPAEIDPTILSQCNTVFALRLSNDRDQELVRSAISDTGSGLLAFLPTLGAREAIVFGDGVSLPVRVRFDELPPDCLPRSASVRFGDLWQVSTEEEGFLDILVERWRTAASSVADAPADVASLAEAVDVSYFGTDIQEGPPRALSRDPGPVRDAPTERREFGAIRRDAQQSLPGAPAKGPVQPGPAPQASSLLRRRRTDL